MREVSGNPVSFRFAVPIPKEPPHGFSCSVCLTGNRKLGTVQTRLTAHVTGYGFIKVLNIIGFNPHCLAKCVIMFSPAGTGFQMPGMRPIATPEMLLARFFQNTKHECLQHKSIYGSLISQT